MQVAPEAGPEELERIFSRRRRDLLEREVADAAPTESDPVMAQIARNPRIPESLATELLTFEPAALARNPLLILWAVDCSAFQDKLLMLLKIMLARGCRSPSLPVSIGAQMSALALTYFPQDLATAHLFLGTPENRKDANIRFGLSVVNMPGFEQTCMYIGMVRCLREHQRGEHMQDAWPRQPAFEDYHTLSDAILAP
jgi:hypothetical protein